MEKSRRLWLNRAIQYRVASPTALYFSRGPQAHVPGESAMCCYLNAMCLAYGAMRTTSTWGAFLTMSPVSPPARACDLPEAGIDLAVDDV